MEAYLETDAVDEPKVISKTKSDTHAKELNSNNKDPSFKSK